MLLDSFLFSISKDCVQVYVSVIYFSRNLLTLFNVGNASNIGGNNFLISTFLKRFIFSIVLLTLLSLLTILFLSFLFFNINLFFFAITPTELYLINKIINFIFKIHNFLLWSLPYIFFFTANYSYLYFMPSITYRTTEYTNVIYVKFSSVFLLLSEVLFFPKIQPPCLSVKHLRRMS